MTGMLEKSMIKICIVVGTRPEAIKLAPIIKTLQKNPTINLVVINTGQHKEMIANIFSIFGINPGYNLDLMTSNQTLSSFTALAIEALDKVIKTEMPNALLVQGDTTTAFCGSLVAFYHKIPVGHIEAGLRTNEKYAPFPEEINRRMIALLADWAFAPTQEACDNLIKENYPHHRIHIVGNTVVDALHTIASIPEEQPASISDKKSVLITVHRRENFGQGFESICEAIRGIAQEHKDVHLVYPVHLNPNIRDIAMARLQGTPNIELLPPLNYVDFIRILKKAHFVITDSGGVQEEAPTFGKPVLVLRESTERPEGVKAGVARLIGSCKFKIMDEARKLLTDPSHYSSMSKAASLYGDGNAASRIVEILMSDLLDGYHSLNIPKQALYTT